MDPLPATADTLQFLAEWGDVGLGPRVAWLGERVLRVAPRSDALAVRFASEDITLVFVAPQNVRAYAAAHPVMRSSVALRVATSTRLISMITVYSEHVDAFTGRVAVIERVLGAHQGSSVLDDDLSFAARRRAESAPAQVRALLVVDTAVGLLMGLKGLSVDEAEDWLDHVAWTSGRTHLEAAKQVIADHTSPSNAPPGDVEPTKDGDARAGLSRRWNDE